MIASSAEGRYAVFTFEAGQHVSDVPIMLVTDGLGPSLEAKAA
jgi:hypothetical protein